VIRDDRITGEVQALQRLDLSGLRAEWRRRWGDPPKFRSRDQSRRAAAYRVQVEAYGGLPTAARRRLTEYAEKFSADRKFTPTPGVALKPGSSLIREWRGQRHEVAVTADGFSYLGEPYRSLSRVAHRITGTKWNGLVFFGLKARGGKGA
jgi:Protein of unknown function (DUF2924)